MTTARSKVHLDAALIALARAEEEIAELRGVLSAVARLVDEDDAISQTVQDRIAAIVRTVLQEDQ